MGKSRKNAGKTTGKCWEYAGDLLVRTMVKPDGFFMIKPFETWQTSQTCGSLEFVLSFFAKASKPTGDSPQVPRLLVSHMFPAVAVQRAQWFRKSDYSGKNA